MLADIDANATVYVQPTSRSVVHSLHRLPVHCYIVACIREQHTVADRRTAGFRYVSGRCRVFGSVLGGREASKAKLDER